ncbi:hypothetical protein GCM10027589_39700 [Actinocorallia lasiicapitis]
MPIFRKLAALSTALLCVAASLAATGPADALPGVTKNPIVLFPAYNFTKTKTTLTGQTIDLSCPTTGSFDNYFPNPTPANGGYTQVCQDRLLTLSYSAKGGKPMSQRFSRQPGVSVQIPDYGKTASAPGYETLFQDLVANGWTRDRGIRVAGYQSDLTPDLSNPIDSGQNFLDRTKALIEETYQLNGNRRVHLVAHSNGPLYAHYLLTHVTDAWRDKFIQGFTTLSGNFPGQGVVAAVLFIGYNTQNFTLPADQANAQSSSAMWRMSPATYMSLADPAIFGTGQVILTNAATNPDDTDYTPDELPQLLEEAHMPASVKEIAAHYVGSTDFDTKLPKTDVYAETVSKVPTLIGMKLPNLTLGQIAPPQSDWYFADGDGNQETITNTAIDPFWKALSRYPYCFHYDFRITESANGGADINHFTMQDDPSIIDRIKVNSQAPKQTC